MQDTTYPMTIRLLGALDQVIHEYEQRSHQNTKDKLYKGSTGVPIQPFASWKDQDLALSFRNALINKFSEVLCE
jgi:hypothetical protein